MGDAAHFESLVTTAYDALPDRFREASAGLSIRVEPTASEHILTTLDLQDPFELLGLYHGINLTQKSVLDVQSAPNEVLLYREPIIAYAEREGLKLSEVVYHVLVHEIGHHFGFSDEDMERLQQS
ncbi:MAG: metallopeptidase family protein [Pseudomonadota bacterium]